MGHCTGVNRAIMVMITLLVVSEVLGLSGLLVILLELFELTIHLSDSQSLPLLEPSPESESNASLASLYSRKERIANILGRLDLLGLIDY